MMKNNTLWLSLKSDSRDDRMELQDAGNGWPNNKEKQTNQIKSNQIKSKTKGWYVHGQKAQGEVSLGGAKIKT